MRKRRKPRRSDIVGVNKYVESSFVRKKLAQVADRSDLKLVAVGSGLSKAPTLLAASASGPSLDALQPAAIGYCQDTTGGVGALASFVTTSHNLAP